MKKLEPKWPHWFTIRGYKNERPDNGGYFQSHTEIYSSIVIFMSGGHAHDGYLFLVRHHLNPYMMGEAVHIRVTSHVNFCDKVRNVEVENGMVIDRIFLNWKLDQNKDCRKPRNQDLISLIYKLTKIRREMEGILFYFQTKGEYKRLRYIIWYFPKCLDNFQILRSLSGVWNLAKWISIV